ncbi:MAG: CBS domain-containing protein [Phycisphaerae bacterium]|nr:CBS domain-containing protein [Phycisphaerae bacterium]
MKVTGIMSSPVISVARDTPMRRVAALMREKRIGAVVVVDADGALLGLVTETDMATVRRSVPFSLKLAAVIYGMRPPTPAESAELMAMAARLTAGDLMTSPIESVREDQEASEVAALMLKHDRRHVPVVRDGKPVGIVARHDLLKLLLRP